MGVELALMLRGEVINCDSIQLYEGVCVATGEISREERRGVPHHLIDFVSPNVSYTAGEWAQAANQKIEEIVARSHTPILVGGTGFYLRAFLNPLFPSPATDDALRSRLNTLRKERGADYVYRILQRLDPERAKILHPGDWPRVQRALEVYLQTGRRISEALDTGKRTGWEDRIRIFVLDPPRAELYSRINERVDTWFGKELFDEVDSLLSSGVSREARIFTALGYRHALVYLEGRWSREEAIERMKIDTRRYAKQQLTWWRSWPNVTWIHRFGNDAEAAREILALLK